MTDKLDSVVTDFRLASRTHAGGADFCTMCRRNPFLLSSGSESSLEDDGLARPEWDCSSSSDSASEVESVMIGLAEELFGVRYLLSTFFLGAGWELILKEGALLVRTDDSRR